MKVPCFFILGFLILFEGLLTQPVYESDIVIIPIVRIENKTIVELALRDLLEDCTPRRISVTPKYNQKCEKLKQCIDRTMDAADEIGEDESSKLSIDLRELRFLKQPLTLIVITEKVEYYPELANYSVKYVVVGGNNTDGADFLISADTLVLQEADQLEEIESFCTQFPKKRIQDEGTPLDLRIHLGFGNITEDGLRDVKYLISTLVTDSRMANNAGMVHIRGPRERTLAVCSWHSYCDLSTFHLDDVNVPLTAIGTEDMDYAPDVIQFLNREYRRKREKKKVYLLLLQDFISPSFLNQGFAFENAEKKQDLSVGMGLFLNENGVTDAIENDYYGGIDYINIYPADEVSDLFLLMNDILTTVGPGGTTDDPSEPTETPEANKTTTTVSPAHLNSHTMIIVVSFSLWTSVEDFDKMKIFIYERSRICLPENENIAVWDGRTMARNPMCTNISCVEAQVTSLSYISPLSPPLDLSTLLTELLLSAVTELKPNSMSKSAILPKLVLFTNYEPVSFLKSYEDANGVLRKKLSTVDFQVVLVNKTDAFHDKLSVSNTHIHRFNTVDDLLNDNQNPFCQENFAVDPPAATPSSSSHITTIIIAFAALLLIILLVILYRMLIYIKQLLRKTDLKEINSNDKRSLVEDSAIGLADFSDCKDLNVKDLSVFGRMAEDPWEMSRQQIIQGEEVGRGNSSVVYRDKIDQFLHIGSLLGRAPCEFIYRKYFFAYQFDNVPVAIKMQVSPSSDISRRQLLDEIEILKSIPPHMNIANMLGCDTSINPVCIVVELANEGNMKDYVKGKYIECTAKTECDHKMPNTVCRHDTLSFLWQICDGLAFIHASGVLHRDVAARNILVQKDRNVLISDFGLAIWKEEGKRNKGTEYLPIKWMSPESLSKGIFTPETDVWSFGICAWEILSGGEEPFSQIPTQEFLAYLNAGKRLHCPEACGSELWAILSECWNEDPTKRPPMSSVGNSIGRILNEISTNYGYLDLTAVDHQPY